MREEGDWDDREDDTDVSVETGQAQSGQGGAPGPKADGAAGNDKEILGPVAPWDGSVQRSNPAAEENQRRGRRANIPTQASWPVIEGRWVLMGRDEWLQRPFWENVLQLPSGRGSGMQFNCRCKCSCRSHDGELTYTNRRNTADAV